MKLICQLCMLPEEQPGSDARIGLTDIHGTKHDALGPSRDRIGQLYLSKL